MSGVSLTKLRLHLWQGAAEIALTVVPCAIVTAVGAVADVNGIVKSCERTCDLSQHPFVSHGV